MAKYKSGAVEYRAGGNPPVAPGVFRHREGKHAERVAFIPVEMTPADLEGHIPAILGAFERKGAILGRADVRALVDGATHG